MNRIAPTKEEIGSALKKVAERLNQNVSNNIEVKNMQCKHLFENNKINNMEE